MDKYSVDVWLQFPAMSEPCRVEVSPRQLFFLDRYTVRGFTSDGRVIYRLPANYPLGALSTASEARPEQLAA